MTDRESIVQRMTAPEVVLVAMAQLAANHSEPSYEHDAIVVETWRIAPAKFGMRGYSYPNSKEVSATLTKLKQQGLVVLVSTRQYRLSALGEYRGELLRRRLNQAGASGSSPVPSGCSSAPGGSG